VTESNREIQRQFRVKHLCTRWYQKMASVEVMLGGRDQTSYLLLVSFSVMLSLLLT